MVDAVMVVFSVVDTSSFQYAVKKIEIIRDKMKCSCPIILVGNKCDLARNRSVSGKGTFSCKDSLAFFIQNFTCRRSFICEYKIFVYQNLPISFSLQPIFNHFFNWSFLCRCTEDCRQVQVQIHRDVCCPQPQHRRTIGWGRSQSYSKTRRREKADDN